MNPERRRMPRKTPAEFNFIRIEQEYVGRVLNFSEEGLCFETMSPIGDQDLVQFLFSVRLLDGIEGFGNIVWMNATRNVGGIKIVHLSRTARQKIQGLINEAPARESVTTEAEPARGMDSGPSPAVHVVEPEHGEVPESAVPHATKADVALEVKGATVEIKTRGPERPERLEVEQRPAAVLGAGLATGEAAETKIAGTVGAVPATESAPTKVPRWPTPATARPPLPKASTPLPFDQAELIAVASTAEREEAMLPMMDAESSEHPEPPAAIEPRELIPLKRHLAVQKSQFIRGALLGIAACFLIGFLVLKFSKPLAPSVSAEVAPTPTSTGSSMMDPSSSPGITLASIGQTTSAPIASKKSRDPGHSSPTQNSKKAPGAVEQFSGTSKIVSYSVETTASEQSVPSTVQNAVSPPATFAPGNAVPAVRSGPLFEPFNKITVPTDAFSSSRASSVAKDAPSGADGDTESSLPAFHRRGSIFSPTAGGVVTPARLVQSSSPAYPREAMKLGLSGEVIIDAIVNASGTLNSIQVVSGPDLLRPAALEAVAKWKYQPALLDGRPTTEHVTIRLKFRAK
jgi:TonB family protein